MTDPRRVEEVFDGAASLAPDAIGRYLDEACAGDEVLRREVLALLASDARADGVAPERIAERAAAAEAALAPTVAADAADEARPDPRVVGRFEVLRKLGEGGMGIVYEAYDARLDRKIAVKLVRFGQGGTGGRTRLLREAQALAKVAHPNVVAIHEVGVVEEEVFVAMELVPGETLAAWLRREPRSWRDALAKHVEAGRGLAAAHAAGLVHRDFKPENVLVGDDGRLRVVDFGLARARSAAPDEGSEAIASGGALAVDLTVAGAVMGTPGYMSPEHFRGAAIDPKSDQFSFAVSVYRALFGSAPFDGDDLGALRDAVLDGATKPPPRTEVPAGVVEAILRALSVEPEERFATMNELLGELERPLALSPELDPSRSRNKRRIAAGLLLLAGVATMVPIGDGPQLWSTPWGLFVLGCIALGTIVVLGIVFRRMLVESAYNRRVAAIFTLPVAGFVVHRALAARMGSPVAEILIGDALSLAVLAAFAGFTVERWMGYGALIALAYAVAACIWPAWAAPGFAGLLLISAAGPIVWWREPKARQSARAQGDSTKKDRSGVGSGRRSADGG